MARAMHMLDVKHLQYDNIIIYTRLGSHCKAATHHFLVNVKFLHMLHEEGNALNMFFSSQAAVNCTSSRRKQKATVNM